jgi:hypothetical protein
MALVIAPLRHYPIIKAIMRMSLLPLEGAIWLTYYCMAVIAPLLTLLFIFGLSLLIWVAFQDWGIVPMLAAKAVYYLALVVTSLAFMYCGDRIVKRILQWYNHEWDYAQPLQFLHPNRVRIYVYGVMAVAYVIANMEKFSSQILIPLSLWGNYRDILVEVLLTIVALDALFTLWQEQRRAE